MGIKPFMDKYNILVNSIFDFKKNVIIDDWRIDLLKILQNGSEE